MSKILLFPLAVLAVTIGVVSWAILDYEEPPPKEFISVCVESHIETKSGINMIPNGQGGFTHIPYTTQVIVCDKYEDQRNPDFIKAQVITSSYGSVVQQQP
jgi:hypothetical protein